MSSIKPKMAKTPDQREREIKLIHVGARELGLDRDSYEAMLWAVVRVRSSADLDFAGRKKVLDHLKSKGFKVKPKAKSSRPLTRDDQSRMIRGLWLELHQVGKVRDPSEDALASFVRRMTGVEALQWLTSAQASRIIEHLKKWRDRPVGKGEE
jgi:phage gp16-like protein